MLHKRKSGILEYEGKWKERYMDKGNVHATYTEESELLVLLGKRLKHFGVNIFSDTRRATV